MGRYSGKTCRLSVMLSLTFTFFIVEIVFGYLTNSMALVADSFHMLSDVVALIIAFFCMKISKKRSSSKNTFGWVRAEVLGALINAVFLIALCFSIFIEALKRLIEPEEIHNPLQILIVGVLGLIVNIIGIFMFHGHASVHGHSHARPVPLNLPLNGVNGVSLHASDDKDDQQPTKKSSSKINGQVTSGGEDTIMIVDGSAKKINQEDGDEESDEDAVTEHLTSTVVGEAHNISFFNTAESGSAAAQRRLSMDKSALVNDAQRKANAGAAAQLNMHGVFLHILGDAFGSIIVIINAIVCWQVDNDKLKLYLDPALSLIMASIIFSTTLPLFKESALILLQTVPTHINVEEIKRKLLRSIDGVLAVHEFHVWRLAGNKIIATAHIRCRNLDEYMKIAESVKQLFHDEGIHSTTIQPEFDEVTEPAAAEICVLECPKEAGETACEPSKCCSAKSAPVLVVSTDPATTAAVASQLEKDSGVKAVASTSTLQQLKDRVSPKEEQENEANIALIDQSANTDQNLTPSGATSSPSPDEDRHKGIPPILYYNKGYNQLGKEMNKDT